jgi:hypothetical protein
MERNFMVEALRLHGGFKYETEFPNIGKKHLLGAQYYNGSVMNYL